MRILRLTNLIVCLLLAQICLGQELEARVSVNHQQVEGSNASVFESLEKNVTAFLNERQWTNLQFKRNERIACSFSITISKYEEGEGLMEASLMVQSTRPVFNSSYTTTVFSTQDPNFRFLFKEFDQLEFRPEVIDNDLTALLAYYAYLIIGLDLDAMSPNGGTEVLQLAKNLTNNAQGLTVSAKGWKAFDDGKNRYGIINDYLDSGMSPFREMQYKYYREGLDVMADNPDRGRAGITAAIDLMKEARQNKPMTLLPQLFTEYKRDELVNIYKGKGTAKEKEEICDILMTINPSQSSFWNQLKQ